MFLYHVFNHNPYSVSNLKATFKASFWGGERGVTVLGSKEFDVYIKDISPGSSYNFYIVNESQFNVQVLSANKIELQIPGETPKWVPVSTGKLIVGTFPISDIDPKSGPLDLPLDRSNRHWDTGCRE